jgi:pyrroline-5-carboxylate reductase
MKIGLIGSGNMGGALARGFGAPVVCSDVDAGRARALADAVGGSVAADNAELAAAADVVILAHKPGQLAEVAAQTAGGARTVISILNGVSLAALREAYPGVPVYRTMPNVAVAVWQGVVGLVDDDGGDPERFAAVRELFERCAEVVLLPEGQLGILTAISGVGPAYTALVAEAQIDAAVRAGLPAPVAQRLVGASLAGSVALLRANGMDTLATRRSVTSPGGVTARGLAALEAGGLRAAFDDALDAVLEGGA